MSDERVVGSAKEETLLRKLKDENVKELLNTSIHSLLGVFSDCEY